MISRETAELVPVIGTTGTFMVLEFEVVIDSTGRPNMATLKINGFGATENRDAIARWIERGRYNAALRNGRPSSAILRGKLSKRVR